MPQQQWHSLGALYTITSNEGKRLLTKLHALLTIESLTQGLEALDPQFNVNLLSLKESDDYYSEILIKPRKLCRKVFLELSGEAMIYAESLCDLEAKACCEYLNCGTTSLGRRLFSGNTLERSEFSYAIFKVEALPMVIQKRLQPSSEIICARRSHFILEEAPLLITEWYLPALLLKGEY